MSTSSEPVERTAPADDSATDNDPPHERPQASSDDSDDDSERLFAAVLDCLELDKLPSFCADIRKQVDPSASIIGSTTIEKPLFGSYHAIFPVQFSDGPRWLLKVPAQGTTAHFDRLAATALVAEARTMRLLRRETTIPIPDVFAFDSSTNNILGCPFILMSWISGISVYDCWFDKSVSASELQARRSRTLKDVATAMVQLDQYTFKKGGSPIFDEENKIVGIGPERWLDQSAMLDRIHDEDPDLNAIYFEAGSFHDTLSFYTAGMDHDGKPSKLFQRGLLKLTRLFLGWIPEPTDSAGGFVLAHADLGIQNVIVAPDGSLQGLIDWDGVAAVPRSVGNRRYPSWLTRDWDPALYVWTEDMEHVAEPKGVWEDSPDILARHRAEFRQYMERLPDDQSQGRFSDPASLSKQQRASSSLTANSLIAENLLIAATNPICTFQILEKLFDEIGKLVGDEQPEDFDFFRVVDALGEGDELLDDGWMHYLRNGFAALLRDCEA